MRVSQDATSSAPTLLSPPPSTPPLGLPRMLPAAHLPQDPSSRHCRGRRWLARAPACCALAAGRSTCPCAACPCSESCRHWVRVYRPRHHAPSSSPQRARAGCMGPHTCHRSGPPCAHSAQQDASRNTTTALATGHRETSSVALRPRLNGETATSPIFETPRPRARPIAPRPHAGVIIITSSQNFTGRLACFRAASRMALSFVQPTFVLKVTCGSESKNSDFARMF